MSRLCIQTSNCLHFLPSLRLIAHCCLPTAMAHTTKALWEQLKRLLVPANQPIAELYGGASGGLFTAVIEARLSMSTRCPGHKGSIKNNSRRKASRQYVEFTEHVIGNNAGTKVGPPSQKARAGTQAAEIWPANCNADFGKPITEEV